MKPPLISNLSVQLLGIVGNHPGGSDGVIGADSQRSGAVEQIVQLVQAGVVEGKAEQGVLDDGVLHVVLTAAHARSAVSSATVMPL